MFTGNQFSVESFMEEKPEIYNNAVHALRQLLLSNFESGKKAKIINSSNRLLITREGLTYFFVEVSDPKGTTYLIEAYGKDALELYFEASNVEKYHIVNK